METNPHPPALMPAGPEHAQAASRLIYSTDPRLWDCLFENDFDRFLRFFTTMWKEEESLYSHSNATVAVAGGRLAGLEVGYDRDRQDRMIPNMVKRTPEILTPGEFRHYLEIVGYIRYLTPPIPNHAYYVLFLATDPSDQGKGIGKRLLTCAFDRARERGYDACHLDVAGDNPAVGFYRRLGMEILSESRVLPLEERGVKSHFRMVKRLR